MKFGYARVSTTDQKLESQIENLKAAGAEKIYQEKFTGTTIERPEFQKILNQLKKDDMLIVTKLDWFARNTREALEIIQYLFQNDIKVHILNMGIIDNTPTGQLIFTIFSAFAQFERDMIVNRTSEGKKYARANDPEFKEGRPQKFSEEKIAFAFELKKQGMTDKMIERKTGVSIATQKRRFKNYKNFLWYNYHWRTWPSVVLPRGGGELSMYTIFVSVVATLVANMLLELFKFWLEKHKQVLKKRNKRH